MNKERRNKITKIIKDLEEIKSRLQSVLSDEEYAFDNMPENLQGSMRGEESEEAIECMDEANDAIENAIEQLEEAVEQLEEI